MPDVFNLIRKPFLVVTPSTVEGAFVSYGLASAVAYRLAEQNPGTSYAVAEMKDETCFARQMSEDSER